MGLQVQGWVEIAARVARASTLDCVHADGDGAIRRGGACVSGVGKAALTALTSAALELAAHLQPQPPLVTYIDPTWPLILTL